MSYLFLNESIALTKWFEVGYNNFDIVWAMMRSSKPFAIFRDVSAAVRHDGEAELVSELLWETIAG